MSDEARGKQYMDEAEKKLKSSGSIFSSIFNSSSSKMDDAAELFQKAGNSYKMAKNWTMAGKAFCQAAEIHLKQNTKHEGANMYNEAANSFKKIDPQEALTCLLKSTDIYIDMGRLVMAAKQYQTIAELYESDVVDLPNSMIYYEKSADLFKTEENNAAANKCLLKVAQFAAQIENYARAIEIYEQIGTASIENNLLKYGARDHFFRAGLCHLCIDSLNCQQAVAKYEGILASFADSRESNFLKQLVSAVDENSLDNFTNVVKEYDSISRLDTWCTTLLLRVKKTISEEPDLR